MTPAAKKLKKPNKTASFKEYIVYYMNRKGWSQSTLAQYARLSQSNVCKIINGNYERTKMESFVSLFLVLQLTVKESKDLLSRAERAFSPASELHELYKDLIWYYSTVHDDTDIFEYVENGLSNRQILDQDASFALKTREIDVLRQELIFDEYKDVNRDIKVHYLFGDSGTGKTRSIYEKHRAADICRITHYPAKGNVQFDAYKGQPVLVFEEFHSQIPITSMLNFLDIYPVMLPARYFDRVACYTTVYITSNIPLEQQYPEIQKCKLETWNAFIRRIHTITEFRKDGFIREVNYESNKDP